MTKDKKRLIDLDTLVELRENNRAFRKIIKEKLFSLENDLENVRAALWPMLEILKQTRTVLKMLDKKS